MVNATAITRRCLCWFHVTCTPCSNLCSCHPGRLAACSHLCCVSLTTPAGLPDCPDNTCLPALYTPPQITGGSDPYVVATLGDSSATTAVKWGELDPEWQETHTLYVTNTDKDVLRLRVIDKNKLMADVELGVVMVAVADLLNGEGQQLELRLRGELWPLCQGPTAQSNCIVKYDYHTMVQNLVKYHRVEGDSDVSTAT